MLRALLAILLLGGCSTSNMRVSLAPGSAFRPTSTMTITCAERDPLRMAGILVDEFLARGYLVISESAARSEVEVRESGVGEDANSWESSARLGRVRSFASDYVFRFSYRTVWGGVVVGDTVEFLTANIVELRTGRVVVSVSFTKGSFDNWSTSEVAGKIVDGVSAEISRAGKRR
jgi:hypothetical protein